MKIKKSLAILTSVLFVFSCNLQNNSLQNNFSIKNNPNQERKNKIIATKKAKKKNKFKTKACATVLPSLNAGLASINDPFTFRLDGNSKNFKFYGKAGQIIKITMSELDMNDAYLKLFSPSNNTTPYTINDDTFGLDSYIETTLTEDGFWTIQVSTQDEAENCQNAQGTFRLSLETDNGTQGKNTHPVTAMDKNGNFVVAWQKFDDINPINGTFWDIYARIFDKNGNAITPPFRVNNDGNNIPGDQINPAIAMNRETGNFIISWEGSGDFYYPNNIEDRGIYFKKYAINGQGFSATFTEPRVSVNRNGSQINPSITMDDDDNAVIVWETTGSTDNSDGIYMRKIYPNATFFGGETKLSQNTTNVSHPKVAITPNRNIPQVRQVLVVWEGSGLGDYSGIFQRKISYDFGYIDPEVKMNSLTNGLQSNPVVAFDYDGKGVVAWQTNGSTDSSDGIKACILTANNAIFATDFIINQTVSDRLSFPSLSINQSNGIHKGDFVLTWQGSGQDYGGTFVNDDTGVYQRRYNVSSSTPLDPEYRNNAYTSGVQGRPSVSLNMESLVDIGLTDPVDNNRSRFVLSWATIMSMDSAAPDGIYALLTRSNDYAILPEFKVD
ncbi:MAG: PPC domain-containing protein [Candidatus Sericytochromatia bacterium]